VILSARTIPPDFRAGQGAGDRAGQLAAYQLRKLQSRQQFTALKLLPPPSRNRGKDRIAHIYLRALGQPNYQKADFGIKFCRFSCIFFQFEIGVEFFHIF
jgi:hypothetical protein